MYRKRFCNMDVFEECVRCDCMSRQHLHCNPPRIVPKGCGFECKCFCDGNSICVQTSPSACRLNVEIHKHPHCHPNNTRRDF